MLHMIGISLIFWSSLWKRLMSPDPKKIQGIMAIPPPKDTTQLQSFLGMVNFMHNFIPHFSQHTATLRSLLSKNAVFHWDESTNAAFQKLKSLIAEAQKRSLRFYNRNLPLTVQADASKHGLGEHFYSRDNQLHLHPNLYQT